MVPDPEAAAEVRDPRDPTELVAAPRGERREPHDRLGLRVEVRELRADVDVDAEHVETAVERVGDERPREVGRQPELRAVVPRADRLVRVGVDAERHPDENALDAGVRRERGLVGRVEHDGSARGRRLAEELAVLVVPVDDELVAGEARGVGEGELAGRGHVRADPLLAEEPEQGDVRERLRAEEHAPVAHGVAERSRARPDRLLAEDDERRAVRLRELLGGHPAEGQRARIEAGGVGKEIWHRPIVPVTVEIVQQLLT